MITTVDTTLRKVASDLRSERPQNIYTFQELVVLFYYDRMWQRKSNSRAYEEWEGLEDMMYVEGEKSWEFYAWKRMQQVLSEKRFEYGRKWKRHFWNWLQKYFTPVGKRDGKVLYMLKQPPQNPVKYVKLPKEEQKQEVRA